MNADDKQRVLAAVARWLDEHPDEALPSGLDPELGTMPEPAPDLLALTAAVTACRHDVQLQGKLFRRLEEGVRQVLDLVASAAATDAAAEAATPAEERANEPLMDLYDRLRRCRNGNEEAVRCLPVLVTRARAAAILAQTTAGLDLVLDRVREHLTANGIEAIDPVGSAFDPQCMRALVVEPVRRGQTAGEVVQTLLVGYRRGEQVLRPAEVKIAR